MKNAPLCTRLSLYAVWGNVLEASDNEVMKATKMAASLFRCTAAVIHSTCRLLELSKIKLVMSTGCGRLGVRRKLTQLSGFSHASMLCMQIAGLFYILATIEIVA